MVNIIKEFGGAIIKSEATQKVEFEIGYGKLKFINFNANNIEKRNNNEYVFVGNNLLIELYDLVDIKNEFSNSDYPIYSINFGAMIDDEFRDVTINGFWIERNSIYKDSIILKIRSEATLKIKKNS